MRVFLTTLVLCALLAAPARATDYLTVTGKTPEAFKGNVDAKDHLGAIQILSFKMASHGTLVLSKLIDGTSPQFLLALAHKDVFKTVTIEVAGNDEAHLTFYKITLTNASVITVQQTAGDRPAEQISLTYEKLSIAWLLDGAQPDPAALWPEE